MLFLYFLNVTMSRKLKSAKKCIIQEYKCHISLPSYSVAVYFNTDEFN